MAGHGTEPPNREKGEGDDQASDRGGKKQSINKPQTSSYVDRSKTNVSFDQRLKRNVLEITLEKTEKDSNMDVSLIL